MSGLPFLDANAELYLIISQNKTRLAGTSGTAALLRAKPTVWIFLTSSSARALICQRFACMRRIPNLMDKDGTSHPRRPLSIGGCLPSDIVAHDDTSYLNPFHLSHFLVYFSSYVTRIILITMKTLQPLICFP